MRARNPRFRKDAWLEAMTQFNAHEGFRYQVVASGGSSMVINRVLLPALRGETEMWKRREPEQYGLTPANYEFAESAHAPDEPGTEVRIALKPRRKHVLLLDGALYLDSEDADLLRVEGRLSKSPSFWVSRVEVMRRYARIKGVRVPVELESVAHVRIAGRSELEITYLYESINGEAIVAEDGRPADQSEP